MHVSSDSSDEPLSFFSIQEAKNLLLGKKVILIEPQNVEWDKRWKIIGVNLSIVSFYAGASAFFISVEKFSTLEHNDTYSKEWRWSNDSIFAHDPLYSKNGSLIYHDHDMIVPNIPVGATAFFATALLPPLLFFLCGKTYYCAVKHFAKKDDLTKEMQNKKLEELFIQLSLFGDLNSLSKDDLLPLPPKFIKKMAAFNLFTEQELQLFSHSQEAILKGIDPELLEVKIENSDDEPAVELEEINPLFFTKVHSFLKNEQLYADLEQLKMLLKETEKEPSPKLYRKIESHLIKKLERLLNSFGLEPFLNLCLTYKLNFVKKALDLKLSFNLPHFFSDNFLKTIQLIKCYSLEYSFDEMTKALITSLEKHSSDPRFITILTRVFHLHQGFIESLFLKFEELLESNPKLLKKLFEEATDLKNEDILFKICNFCKSLEKSHISLANWNRPPDFPLTLGEDKGKEKEKRGTDHAS